MSGSSETDAVLRFCCKMLHSSDADSAEKIRQVLDEQIRLRYGAHRMLINTLPKHHLASEARAVGSGIPAPTLPPPSGAGSSSGRRQSSRSMDSRASSMAKDSPLHIPTITLLDSDVEDEATGGGDQDEDEALGTTDEENMRELEDLMCQVCRRMDVSAHNRLIECVECHALYHQDCHKPTISDTVASEQEFTWRCSDCQLKPVSTVMPAMAAVTAAAAAVAITDTTSPAKSSSQSRSSSSSAHKQTTKPQQHAAVVTPSMPSLGPSIAGPSTPSGSGSHHGSHYKSSKSSSSSRHHHHSSTSSASKSTRDRERGDREREREREERPSTSATAAPAAAAVKTTVTPNINIISNDKRLANMKRKSKKNDPRRKHK